MRNVFLLLFVFTCISVYSQEELKQNREFVLKTGYGYFNDGLMIDGSVLWSEIGIKSKNGYIVSLNYKFSETVNDKYALSISDNISVDELNYSYNIYTLYVSYPFTSKNGKHHVLPKIGPYYSRYRVVQFDINSLNILHIGTLVGESIGFSLGLEYQYSLNNTVAIGLVSDFLIAYQYGAEYLVVTPSVSVRF